MDIGTCIMNRINLVKGKKTIKKCCREGLYKSMKKKILQNI